MSEMNSLTLNGKTYDCFVDDVARSSLMICSVSGESIAVSDSSDQPLVGLNLYGKSTQAGSPTPDAPVDIVSAGDDGEIKCELMGKNLFDAGNLKLTTNAKLSVLDDGYTITATGGKGVSYASSRYDLPLSLRGKNLCLVVDSISTEQKVAVSAQVNVETPDKMDYFLATTEKNAISFAVPSNATRITIGVYTNNSSATLSTDNTVTVKGMRLMLVENKAYGWTKAVDDQGITLSRTLRGVPVTDKTLATYTDVNGQMWCADEIDFERGVLVQRVYAHTFTEHNVDYLVYSESDAGNSFTLGIGFTRDLPPILSNNSTSCVMSDIATGISNNERGNKDFFSVYCADGNHIIFRDSIENTVLFDTFKDGLPGREIIYILATPIETPLTDEEIAAYKALHTNKPSTTVLNDSGAFMSVKYIADLKSYIDNKVSGILTATVE